MLREYAQHDSYSQTSNAAAYREGGVNAGRIWYPIIPGTAVAQPPPSRSIHKRSHSPALQPHRTQTSSSSLSSPPSSPSLRDKTSASQTPSRRARDERSRP